MNAKVYLYHPAFHDYRNTSLYHPTVDDRYESYVYGEWQVITEYLETYLGSSGTWINSPLHSRKIKNKIYQLDCAKKNYLHIPKTIITNESESINKFFNNNFIGIHKSISESGEIDKELVSRTSMFYTQEINENSGIEIAPGCFQEFISSEVELRTYIAGNDALTVVIKNQNKLLIPDIRSQPKNDDFFTISSLFSDYEKKLIDLLKKVGIKWAAIDSIVTESRIVFLEINPNGTWSFLPKNTRDIVSRFYWNYVLRYIND
jgi:glutathione synthase/RimK-type ligase-like ATP-grasp enzyme